MQRMGIYLSGIPVPRLGSMKDRVLREYLSKQSHKEVYKHKVVALSGVAMANMSKTPEATVKELINSFTAFVNMEMGLDRVVEDIEDAMRDEFEFWKKVRPKVNISKDGKSATLSVASLRPRS